MISKVALGYCPCGNPCENPDTGLCASCGAAARKAERQAKKIKVSAPINQVSPKRAGQLQEYAKLRKEYLALYPVCETEECHNPSRELHHMAGREGDKLLDTNYFMAVCPECHRKITEHSAQAIQDGYSIKRTI